MKDVTIMKKTNVIRGARMQAHFSRLAPLYNQLRTTDLAPVQFIADTLAGQHVERCADMGCGSGRYDLMLLRAFPGIHLTCWDINRAMLDEAEKYLRTHGESRFSLRVVNAESLCTSGNIFDFIVSFNAIHHFDPVAFLGRSSKLLRSSGKIFLYTRLHEQNEETIWGRYFPGFLEKEKRLYRKKQIYGWLRNLEQLELDGIKILQHTRSQSLRRLIELAKFRHYSTFAYYTDRELREAIDVFRQRLRRHFAGKSRIEWQENNAMIIVQAAKGSRHRRVTQVAAASAEAV